MQQLINQDTKTMSSLELLELVNEKRLSAGESKVAPKDFIVRVIDELEDVGNFNKEIFLVNKLANGTEQKVYTLTLEQCTLVGMRESKAVRRAVLAKLKELEATQKPALPTTYIEALEALVASEKVKAELMAKNSALATALDQEFGYCSILRAALFLGISEKSFSWRKLKAESLLIGYPAKKAPSPRYGYQNLYPLQAFRNVYLEHDFEGLTPDPEAPELLTIR